MFYKNNTPNMFDSPQNEPPPTDLPVLYARRSDGRIQEWQIEIDGARYRTVSGIIDGAKVTSEWTVAVPKNVGRSNATTPEEQALAEAKSHWQKKVDLKYTPDIDKVGTTAPFAPMLAKEWSKQKKKVEFPVCTQPKLDGMRCICTATGMISRNGKGIYSAPHVAEILQPLFDKFPDLIFDGELYNHRLHNDFDEIISLCRKSKPTASDLEESRKTVQYWVYDLPSHDGKFSERSIRLRELVDALGAQETIVFVPTTKIETEEELNAQYDRLIAENYEGQMIRVDAPYDNKRSKNLLKRKEFDTTEFKVVAVLEGVGNRANTAGSLTLLMEDGRKFNSNIKGGFKLYRELWERRDELIGMEVTVRHFKLTPDGIPRFPFVIAIRDYE